MSPKSFTDVTGVMLFNPEKSASSLSSFEVIDGCSGKKHLHAVKLNLSQHRSHGID